MSGEELHASLCVCVECDERDRAKWAAMHVRTDPACVEHDGRTPSASRGFVCRACQPVPPRAVRLDIE